MSDKICLINQPAGLGDIFWLQPIVDDIASRGFEVVYPVCSQYLGDVKEKIKTNNSNFCSIEELEPGLKEVFLYGKEPIIKEDFEYWPFDHIWSRPELQQYHTMDKKFRLYEDITGNRLEQDWQKRVQLIRDEETEQKYYDKVVGDNKEYIWVNNTFGTPPNIARRPMRIDWDGHMVINNANQSESIFDCLKVIELAKEIHTVETSFGYLIDIINTTEDLNLYSRKSSTEQHIDLDYADMLFSKKWRKHL